MDCRWWFCFLSCFFIVGGFAFCPVFFSSLVVLLFAQTQHFQKVLSKDILYTFFSVDRKNDQHISENSLKWCIFNGSFGHFSMSFTFCSVFVCLNICQTTNMFYQKWMMFSKFNSSKQVFETFRLRPKSHEFVFSQRLESSLEKFFLKTSPENSLKCALVVC